MSARVINVVFTGGPPSDPDEVARAVRESIRTRDERLAEREVLGGLHRLAEAIVDLGAWRLRAAAMRTISGTLGVAAGALTIRRIENERRAERGGDA